MTLARRYGGKDYVYVPGGGYEISLPQIQEMYPDATCKVVILDQQQIAYLLSLSRLLRYSHLWGLPPRAYWAPADIEMWDGLMAQIDEMEYCLMAGCDLTPLVSAWQQSATALSCLCQQLTGIIPAIAGTIGPGSGDAPPGEQGGTPPPGYDDHGQDPQVWKCKLANLIFDEIYAVIDEVNSSGVLENLSLGAFLTILGVIIGGLVTAVLTAGLVLGVLGGLAGLALAIYLGAAQLPSLLTFLVNNRDDLVCALYSAESADEAKQSFLDVAEGLGLDSDSLAILQAFMWYSLLNTLYFEPEDAALQAYIAAYSPASDCSECVSCQTPTLQFGSTSDNYTFSSVYISSPPGQVHHRIEMTFPCPIIATIDSTSGWTDAFSTGQYPQDVSFEITGGQPSVFDLPGGANAPIYQGQSICTDHLTIRSGTTFSANIDIGANC